MPYDVSLHFRRAGFDRVPARSQVTVRPDSVVHGVLISREQLPVRPKYFLRDLLKTLIQFAPEYFLNRAFGPRNAGRCDAAERTQLIMISISA